MWTENIKLYILVVNDKQTDVIISIYPGEKNIYQACGSGNQQACCEQSNRASYQYQYYFNQV